MLFLLLQLHFVPHGSQSNTIALFISLFSLMTLHNRSYQFLTSSTFRLFLGCLVLGFVYISFWNLKMSSSLFATDSRFTFKFLLLFCRCRSVGAGSPYHTFWIHLPSHEKHPWYFICRTRPSATYWLRLNVFTKLCTNLFISDFVLIVK